MNKVISYSLFGSRTAKPENRFEFLAYMRIFYFNVCMNSIIYPDFVTHVEIDSGTFSDYDNFFYALQQLYGITFNVNSSDNLCKSMLWRLKAVFKDGNGIVLCRDADALTSYREAQTINRWINTDKSILGLNDNDAHSIPLMGGMVGFKTEKLKEKYKSFDELISLSPIVINERGTDQTFLMKVIYPDFEKDISIVDMRTLLVDKSNRLWESNLCSAFCGAAGVNELECIRYFMRNDNKFTLINHVGRRYKDIFYWLL